MPVTEYERGFRDGITKAAQLAEKYVERFGLRGDAAMHMRAMAEGLSLGALGRDALDLGSEP